MLDTEELVSKGTKVGGKITIQTNAQMKKRWVETYRDKYLEMLEDEELMGEYIKNFGKKEIKELFGLLTQTYEAMDLLEKHNELLENKKDKKYYKNRGK